MPQELRFSTLKENGGNFGNFFPPEVDLSYFFPECCEEHERLYVKPKKRAGCCFTPIDEIRDEQIDHSFESWIPEYALTVEEELELDEFGDDLFEPEKDLFNDIDWLIHKFGDGETEIPKLLIPIVKAEDKEDKQLSESNFIPFSKNKIKCEVHKRKYGRKGRKKNFRLHIHTKKFDPEIGIKRIIKKFIVSKIDRFRMLREKMKILSGE